jgi:hypothetical protein
VRVVLAGSKAPGRSVLALLKISHWQHGHRKDTRRTTSTQEASLQNDGSVLVLHLAVQSEHSSLRTRFEAVSAGTATTDATSAKRTEKAANFIAAGLEGCSLG